MNPVSAGAIHPARFPVKFCRPVHLPAVDAPARVCVIAQRLEVHMPMPRQTKTSRAMAAVWLDTIETRIMLDARIGPAPVNVLRTHVTLAPVAIHRSESHPEVIAETAMLKKAPALAIDIRCTEKWRSLTK